MEITGKIIVIGETETVGTKGFQKRLLVVETDDPKYPQKIPLEFVKDKTEVLDNFSVGQQVTVSFNLRGNEYNGRYYLSAQGWKIEGGTGGSAKPAAQKTAGKTAPKQAAKAAPAAAASDDDAPWN
jgi:single-strand DNA-binding protein